jgi:sugar phosphate isomerase/epimerase
MKIGLSGGELAVTEGVRPLIEACGRLGVRWVELWYPLNTEAMGLEGTLALLAGAGIAVDSIGTATELGGDGSVSDAQRTVEEAVEVADHVGCGLVNTYFGWPSIRDDTRSIRTFCANLEPCLAAARRSGVVITLENEFDSFGRDPIGADVTRRTDALERLVDAVGSAAPFGITFDPCNAYFAGVDPAQMYERLAAHIVHVHVKDGFAAGPERTATPAWRRFLDHGCEYSTCALGEGEIGWGGLLGAMAERGYRGLLTLEPHVQRAKLADAWEQALGYLRLTTGALP